MPNNSILSGAASGAATGTSILPGWGTAIGAVGGALISALSGGKQKREAERLLAGTQYPTYTVPTEVMTNKRNAAMRANVGLPSEMYKQTLQNIERQRNAAIRTALDRRQGQAAVPVAQQIATDATLKLNAANADARMQGERQLMAANAAVANAKDQEWAWNTQNKYNRDYNYAMALKGRGNQNLVNAADSVAAGLTYAPWGDFLKPKAANTGQPGVLVSDWKL